MGKKENIGHTRKLVFIALLVTQGIVLSFFERLIPFNMGVPGAKLGLANIITLASLYIFPFKDTLTIVLLRSFLGSFLLGSMSSFAYSISGGILSFLAMYGVMKMLGNSISEVSVSIVGAIFHNIGQLLMASIILSNIKMIYYLPFLMLSAIATGLIVGLTGKILIKYLTRIVSADGNY